MKETTQGVLVNSRALIEAMGRWPSFHDAKVLKASRIGDDCQVDVHVFEMTGDVDAAGYFILKGHHIVTFHLRGIASCNLPDDYDGDILDSIEARRCEEGTTVVFESIIDPARSLHVVCREARLNSVRPCDSDGSVN